MECVLLGSTLLTFFFFFFFFFLPPVQEQKKKKKRWSKQSLKRVAEEKMLMRGQKERDDRGGAREMRGWIELGNKGAAWNKAYKAAVAVVAEE